MGDSLTHFSPCFGFNCLQAENDLRIFRLYIANNQLVIQILLRSKSCGFNLKPFINSNHSIISTYFPSNHYFRATFAKRCFTTKFVQFGFRLFEIFFDRLKLCNSKIHFTTNSSHNFHRNIIYLHFLSIFI